MLRCFGFGTIIMIGAASAMILSIDHWRADALTPSGAHRQAAPDNGTWNPVKQVRGFSLGHLRFKRRRRQKTQQQIPIRRRSSRHIVSDNLPAEFGEIDR